MEDSGFYAVMDIEDVICNAGRDGGGRNLDCWMTTRRAVGGSAYIRFIINFCDQRFGVYHGMH